MTPRDAICCGLTAITDSDTTHEAADTVLEQLAMRGFAVVPVEPTVEMLTAGTEEWLTVRAMEDRAEVIWRAMIAAAQEDGR